MDGQFSLATREDFWRLQNEMKNVYATQAEHADRLTRLERRHDEDARMKSVWGSGSPFPGVLNGTPQQGKCRQKNQYGVADKVARPRLQSGCGSF